MSSSDTEWWDITVKSERGAPLDTTGVRAKSRDEAIGQVADWDVYEGRLRTEHGGTTWASVFAPGEDKAREQAFERSTAYVDVLDVEVYDRPFRVRGTARNGSNSEGDDAS